MRDVPAKQHAVASGVVAAIGAAVCYASFTQAPAEAFLFPRIVSSVFLALALWTFGKALLGRSRVGEGLSAQTLRNIAPGLAVALVHIFWGAETLGFYASSAVSFLIMLAVYDPAPHSEVGSWIRRLAVATVYTAAMYGLFAALLKVYTPRGIFI